MHVHSCARTACAALLLLLPFAGGCSMGFTSLKPGENAALYAPLHRDIPLKAPLWPWTRGTVAADLDGDGAADEEAVLVTLQGGTEKRPGPVEAAFLFAVRVEADGRRTEIARTPLFLESPVPGAPRPANSAGAPGDAPFTRCGMQKVKDKESFRETVVACFWSAPAPFTAWYAGYGLTENGWEKNLETALLQTTPGCLAVNLDKRIESSRYGYQLLLGAAAVPADIMAKLASEDGTPAETPLWGHVFARNDAGQYVQSDARFAEHYRTLEPAWTRAYLKALMKNLPPEELAWFEYHLALLNRYAGEEEMARGFLEKAESGATDPDLRAAIRRINENW